MDWMLVLTPAEKCHDFACDRQILLALGHWHHQNRPNKPIAYHRVSQSAKYSVCKINMHSIVIQADNQNRLYLSSRSVTSREESLISNSNMSSSSICFFAPIRKIEFIHLR